MSIEEQQPEPEHTGETTSIPQDASDSTQRKIRALTHVGNQTFKESLHSAYERVVTEGNFSTVDLPFTEEEVTRLSALRISEDCHANYYGTAANLEEQLVHAFDAFTDDPSLRTLCYTRLIEIVRDTLLCFGTDAAWVSMRAATATGGRPLRWHRDGRFFIHPENDRLQMKLAFCFCGESTYFAKLNRDDRTRFEAEESNMSSLVGSLIEARESGDHKGAARINAEMQQVQDTINSVVPTQSTVIPLTARQGGLFAVGSKDLAGIHSEPPFTQPRIFASIVPGSHAEVEELRQRWIKKV